MLGKRKKKKKGGYKMYVLLDNYKGEYRAPVHGKQD